MPILKKIFFFCLFLFVLSLLLWGVYNLSFKTPASQNSTATTTATPANTTPTFDPEKAKITALTQRSVLAPILTSSGQSVKYFSKDGSGLYETDLDGKNENTLDGQTFSGLANAFWSPDQTTAELQFFRNGQTSFVYKNFSTHQELPLKNNLDKVAWQTNANRIFYKYYDPKSGERTLNVSDPDGRNWKKLADLVYHDVSIAQVPQSSLVSYWNTGDAFSQTNFQTISVLGGTPQTLLSNVYGADYLWNSSGSYVLVSHTDSKGGHQMQLAVMNYNGGEYHNLDVDTLVSKCVWSTDAKTVYCAVPGNIPSDAVMPNDWNNHKFNTSDTFWKIDTTSGQKSQLIDPKNIPGQYDATNLFLNQDESALFFVNRFDGKLYKLSF